MAIFAPVVAPRSYDKTFCRHEYRTAVVGTVFSDMKPVTEGGYITINDDYPLGADGLGRDLLSRIIYGSRISLGVALVGPLIGLSIGLAVGHHLRLCRWAGGHRSDAHRRCDVRLPDLLLIILLMAFFRTSFSDPSPGTLAYTLGQS